MLDHPSLTGLTAAQAAQRQTQFGFNEIAGQRTSSVRKLLRQIFSPITLMLLAAAFLSLLLGKDFDFYFILFLTAVNLGVTFWQEHKADRAIEELQKQLTVLVTVLRDGVWTRIESSGIVPDDVVRLSVGDIAPADGAVLEESNVSANEAALTGESLPKEKKIGDTCYAGSYIATGSVTMRITATGNRTFFGKSIVSLERSTKKSLLEKDILTIDVFLSVAALIGIVLLSSVLFLWHKPVLEVLDLDLGLLIAGIPVALPAVMALIISLGIVGLAKKNVVVRRISAIEDLSNVDLLLSDKTGTLTENKIEVARVIAYQPSTEANVMRYGYWSSVQDDRSAINQAIIAQARLGGVADQPTIVGYVPADSVRKHSSASVRTERGVVTVAAGAPQVITSLCALDGGIIQKLNGDVAAAARDGYRVIAIAFGGDNAEEKNMSMAGILLISDTVRADAADTIAFMQKNGIAVKMVTGDDYAIAQRVSGVLGLSGDVVRRDALASLDPALTPSSWLDDKAAFAQVLPQDKYALVQIGKKSHVVAATGDGVNDLPALSIANVGIAVKEAVDALRSAADIVLLSSGIAVIKDAVIEARKIFSRMYTYSLYRLSESFRLIVTIVVLGIVYATYPLTPIQLILLALMNDLPIISLATDRVALADRPAHINVKDRFVLSTLYGLTGVANSLLLFFIAHSFLHLSDAVVQTMFFLKLTVGGHMLIYVAHTKERWYKYWPSSAVIWATSLTQAVATGFAIFGFFMHGISPLLALAVWVWAFFWMQVSEGVKWFDQKYISRAPEVLSAPTHA